MPVEEADVSMLEDLEEEAEEVEPASGGGNLEIPLGEHQVRIEEPSSGFLARDSNNVLRARVVLRLTNSPDENLDERATDVHSWRLVDEDGNLIEQGVSILKSALQTMGVEFTRLGEVDELLAQCAGAVVTVNRKKNGDYTNTYINDLVHPSDAVESGGY